MGNFFQNQCFPLKIGFGPFLIEKVPRKTCWSCKILTWANYVSDFWVPRAQNKRLSLSLSLSLFFFSLSLSLFSFSLSAHQDRDIGDFGVM